METYTGTQIRASINEGTITCIPFREHQIEARSLLVSLGSYYYRTEQDSPSPLYNPLDPEDVERYFDGPFKALSYAQQSSLSGLRRAEGIAADRPVILLKPGECIIAHTYEFIGASAAYTVRLEELSGWRQSGIHVDMPTQETGSVTRQSLIIRNSNTSRHVALPVAVPIARLFFTTNPDKATAAILSTNVIDTAISTWTPATILAGAMSMPAEHPAAIEGLNYE